MEKDKFDQAKYIREKIDHLNVKKTQLEAMKSRDNDEDFTIVRQLAHDSICYSINRLEQDFKDL